MAIPGDENVSFAAGLTQAGCLTSIPHDLTVLLRRVPTAAALTEAGYPTSPLTLATLATRGGGPPFRKYGRYSLYCWGDALAWAQAKLGPVVTSTSELDAVQCVPSNIARVRQGASP